MMEAPYSILPIHVIQLFELRLYVIQLFVSED